MSTQDTSLSFEDFEELGGQMFEQACEHSTSQNIPLGVVLAGVIFHLAVEAQLNELPVDLLHEVIGQAAPDVARVEEARTTESNSLDTEAWKATAPQNKQVALCGAEQGGAILEPAILSPLDAAYLNFARQEHSNLEKILLLQIIPALGGYENELACDIARHLEQIRTFSGNYCWRHRHLGAAHDAVNVGGGK